MLYQPEERRKNLQCLLSHPSILIVVRLYPMNALPLYASHVIEGPNIQQLTTVPTLYLFFLYIKDLALPAIHFFFHFERKYCKQQKHFVQTRQPSRKA